MAVYFTDKLDMTSEMFLYKKSNNILNILKVYEPIVYDEFMNKDKFKKEKVRHFISGEIVADEQGKYHINKTTLKGRNVLALDYDGLPISFEEFIQTIKRELSEYHWVAYKTMSHTKEATYCRLIVELDGLANEGDYKATIKEIGLKLPYVYDGMSETFTQRMAFPVKRITDNNYNIESNDGKPFKIVKGKRIPKERSYYFSNEINAINDDLALDMFKIYLELERKELEYDFKNFFTCVSRLARAVLTEEISYDVALECVDLLAYGNSRYLNNKINNQYYLNGLIKRKDINSLSNYSFKAMIRVAINIYKDVDKENVKNLVKLYNNLKGEPTTTSKNINYYDDIQNNNLNVRNCLNVLYKEWVSENITFKMSGKMETPNIRPSEIGNIILKCVPMVKTGQTEKTATLFIYNYTEKRYIPDTELIYNLVQGVYEHIDPRLYPLVVSYIKAKLEHKSKGELPDLAKLKLTPVKNGMFDMVNKCLLPFDYKLFVTTKSPINYNKNAKKPDFFDPDKWFNELACNHKETFNNLWELIADVVDISNERGGIHFLLGDGNNGKGTFIQLIKNLIGLENISALHPQDFSNRFDTSTLIGKTCNIGDDIPPTTIDNPSKLKSVSTGDFISVEEKGKPKHTVEIKLGLIFTANKLPLVNDTTNGFYRRMNIIPFEADFNGKVENKAIKKEYINDVNLLEYILKRALELDFSKFTTNPKGEEAKEKYKEDNDNIRSYILNEYIPNGYSNIIEMPQSFVMENSRHYWEKENIKPLPRKPTTDIIKVLNELHPHRTYSLSEYPTKMNQRKKDIMREYGILEFYTGNNTRYIILESDEKVELLKIAQD